MPQIPQSTEQYAFTPTPTENPAASGIADQALAEGLGRVDQAFGMVAERSRHMQQLTDAATIDSSNAINIGALQQKYAADPDPATAAQRFTADATAMKQASIQGISDPNVQALVSRNFDQRIVSHTISLQQSSFRAQRIQQDAGVRSSLDDYAKAVAAAPNDDEAGRNVDMANAALAGGVSAGVYTPLQQRAMLSQTVRQAVELRGAADPSGANALAGKYESLLTAADQVAITNQLKPALLRQATLAGVNGITGTAAGGAAATAGTNGGIAASSEGGADPSDAVANAIYAQESGSGANPSTSVDGAKGGFQIMPATFAQYAKPGESIDNPADNQAVGRRIVQDLYTKSGGDAARTAAGYFSGPGNMAPAGAATPYVRDAADGNGKTTSSYVSDVMSRLGASVPGMPTFQAPNLDDWQNKARALANGDPDMEQRLVAGVTARYSQWHSATQVQRAQLGKQLGDTEAALSDGRDVAIPEPQIRALFPSDQADSIMGKLQDAQKDGLVMTSVRLASPDDLASMRANLADGVGPVDPVTKQPKGRAGIIAAAANNPALGDTSVSDTAAGGNPAAPDDGSANLDGYRQNRMALARFDRAVTVRNQSLAADPAAYVAQSPPVAAAAQAIDPKDPSTFEAFAAATHAEQTRLGVPDAMQRTLPVSQIQSTVQALTSADPSKVDVGAQLSSTAAQYGSAWPGVFGDLVRVGKLPREYQMLATMDQPGQASARADLTRALQATAQRGGMSGLEKDAPPDQVKAINGALDDAISPFRQTAAIPGVNGNVQQIADTRDTVRQLALFYAVQGMDGTSAVKKAADGILDQKYDFGSQLGDSTQASMRTPKGMWNAVDASTRGVIAGLQSSDLAPLPSSGVPAVDAQRQADVMSLIKSGTQWVPNEDDSGLVAYVRPRDGSVTPVKLASGKRLEVKFNALPQPAQAPAPQVPMYTPVQP